MSGREKSGDKMQQDAARRDKIFGRDIFSRGWFWKTNNII